MRVRADRCNPRVKSCSCLLFRYISGNFLSLSRCVVLGVARCNELLLREFRHNLLSAVTSGPTWLQGNVIPSSDPVLKLILFSLTNSRLLLPCPVRSVGLSSRGR